MHTAKLTTMLGIALFLLSIGMPVPQAQNDKLVIYTYDSLLADPGYDFVGNFSQFAGIPKENIKVVKFEDAGSILTRAIAEKDSPVADVLIGIDNVMVHQARAAGILEAYKPNGAENLRQDLIESLASDYLLTPYDYGVFAVWYDESRFSGFGNNFSLDALRNPEVASKLVVENPQISSVGLGFLLWSIAEYGATALGNSSDTWLDFWSDLAKNDARLTPSWGDALDLFFDAKANRSIMISYTTSPAYGQCNYGEDTTNAIVSKKEGKYTGWFQIEGLGITKGSSNKDLAKKFVDWFISDELQSQIYGNQYMYPALETVETPQCYVDSTISKDDIVPLNSKISGELINQTLDTWLAEWEETWANATSNGVPGFSFYLSISSIIAIVLIARRKKVLKA